MTETRRGEWARKAVHLGTVLLPLAVWFLPRHLWLWPLLALTASLLVIDFARLGHAGFGRFFRSMIGPALRRHEADELLGASYLLLACLIAALLFPRAIAVASMSYLILGDGLAGLVGRSWGRLPLAFGKTFEGTLACFAACLLVGWLVFREAAPMFLGASLATVVELLPLPLDDNLAIPLVTGTVLWWAVL